MTPGELRTFVGTLKGFFPEATEEQALLVAETAQRMDARTAIGVLKTHKRLHDFFSVKTITEALTSEHRKTLTTGREGREQRVIDWLRAEGGLDGVDDMTALNGHFVQGRLKLEEADVGPTAKREARQMLFGHATRALVEIGVPRDEAAATARAWC